MKQTDIRSNKGFTLIELLVVVSILATLSGIAVSAVGGYIYQAREDLVATDMQRIGKAVMQFQADTGYFPGQGPFARPTGPANNTIADKSDFSFLFFSPRQYRADGAAPGAEILPWDTDTDRGWNGPYLDSAAMDYLCITGCQAADLSELTIYPVHTAQAGQAKGRIGLEDPFKSRINSKNASSAPCFVTRGKSEKTSWQPRDYAGTPYLYETGFKNDRYPECPETGSGCIALVSAGKNGKYENGSNDDVVRILRMDQ